jgi:hypothetical protein
MARYLLLWRWNTAAQWPADPSESLKLSETMLAAIDDLIKKGELEQSGFFPDGGSGYMICRGEVTDVFRISGMLQPYMVSDVHEIIPWAKAKEIALAMGRAMVEEARK